MSDSDVPGPNDPTRTRAPQPADAPPGPNDPTRTRAPGASDANAGTEPPARNDRLPAPLQYRDPDRYHVIGEHGRGGLGRVLRARDKELGRDVAVKELLERGNTSELRFFREALITARLEHPGIVPVHEAGRWPDGTPFYAMKLVQGRSLRELIDDCKTMEDRLALIPHVIAVADAIAYAHDRKIIHRDLKPSNVIVGDFGETVVIDWGLAKDITDEIPEPTEAETGAPRAPAAEGLTAAGSVLGTPAYMAPEQRDGKADERSDVYALGGILLHILTGAAPRDGSSGAVSSRSNVRLPRDLVAIISRARAQHPEHRYPSASKVARDLREYSQRRPVSARRYSLMGRAALSMSRNRLVAVALIAAVVTVAAVLAIETYRIEGQREVAVAARNSAEAARQVSVDALDSLTLKHAQLLLSADPSAAMDAISSYHGREKLLAEQVRAEAAGRGVAILRAIPHADNVIWTTGNPDGTVVALSLDGTISETMLDGTSHTIARGAEPIGAFAFATGRHILAYGCGKGDVCLLDTMRRLPLPARSALRGLHTEVIAFSPSARSIASCSRTGQLLVLDVADWSRPQILLKQQVGESCGGMQFFQENELAVGVDRGLMFVELDGRTTFASIPDGSDIDFSVSRRELVVAANDGRVLLLDTQLRRITREVDACPGEVHRVRFVPGRDSVAYACRAGSIGIWNLGTGALTVVAHMEGHADSLELSRDGSYIVAAGGNGSVAVLSTSTGLVSDLKGSGYRIISLQSPTAEFPFVVSGDARGGVRVWPLPVPVVRVAAQVFESLKHGRFVGPGQQFVGTTVLGEMTVYSPRAGLQSIGPHVAGNWNIAVSDKGGAFATFGYSDEVEVWEPSTMTRRRLVATGHGIVTQLVFVDEGVSFLTAGRDGRLLYWPQAGEAQVLAEIEQPIDSFIYSAVTDTAVLVASDGSLWRVQLGHRAELLRSPGGRVNRLQLLPGATSVLVACADGALLEIDIRSARESILFKGSGAVGDVATSPSGDTIAAATNDGIVHVERRHASGGDSVGVSWTTLPIRSRRIAFVGDEFLVAACTDGAIWVYSLRNNGLRYVPTGVADLTDVLVSNDGASVLIYDTTGRVLWIDFDRALAKTLTGI